MPPAVAQPSPTAKVWPIIIRDALGERTLTFETESSQLKACVRIQMAVTKVSGAKPKAVVSLEGTTWFCSVQSIFIPAS